VTDLTAQVLRHALVVAAEEAGIVVVRSAYSTFIVEGSDAAAAIMDRDGRLIAHSMATTLMNSMALSVALPALLADFPAASMRPGDVFAMNDAYRGGVHTNDILIFRPVFTDAGGGTGAPGYFAGTMIHVADLGGLSAGGMAPLATEIFLEGLQLPPVRIATADGLDGSLAAILRLNSRTPDTVMGDVRALMAGAAVAAHRVEALLAERGPGPLARDIEAYLNDSEERMTAALAAIPQGTYTGEYPIDDDGIHPGARMVRVRVEVGAGRVRLDFAGTDPQVPAAINATTPHPTGGRFVPIYAAMEAVFQAMSAALPERAIAASGIIQPFSIASAAPPYWIHLAYDFGGVGARAGKDGPDCTGIHFGVGRNSIPQVEPTEARTPLRIERLALIPDSGGPGRWRGGLGTRTVFRLRADAHVTTRGDRLTTPPPGRDGGRPGRPGGFYRLPPGESPQRLPAKVNNAFFAAGDAFVVETTGGGGIGDPAERPHDAVRADLAARKITKTGAERDYA
jgi:N-methylhydantoinase B